MQTKSLIFPTISMSTARAKSVFDTVKNHLLESAVGHRKVMRSPADFVTAFRAATTTATESSQTIAMEHIDLINTLEKTLNNTKKPLKPFVEAGRRRVSDSRPSGLFPT
jgi:hypothetical protein